MDMKKIAITTDTNSGMIPHEQDDKGIFVLPMPFVVDGESLLDRVDLSLDDFYVKLIGGAKVSTSQPSAADVSEFWTEILKEYDEIVHIPTSSFLSAACSTAQALSAEFGGKVRVVDNHAISLALRASVINAATLRDKGLSTEEIATTLESMTNDYSVYFSLHGMEYLKRGGRISAAAAAIGSILKLRPVLHLNDGKLEKFATPRTPVQAKEFSASARENGFGALICAAGMAAQLAGAIAANTVLPVIGIPCKSSNLDGLDALLSTVMMPTGIPVATVAIDGGGNAALLAAQILATADDALYEKLVAKRRADAAKVLEKDAALQAELNQ